MESEDKTPKVSLITAIFIVIANMIGTGVFTTLGFQVQALNNFYPIVFLWLLGGIVALSGALVYSEIGSMFPRCGAEYHYLSKIYHPSFGFVSGFVSVFVGFSAPIALASMAFASYIKPFFFCFNEKYVAITIVTIITIVHLFGIKSGSKFQFLFTLIKISLILTFCFFGFFFTPIYKDPLIFPSSKEFFKIFSPSFAVSLIYVSYAYSGWNGSAYIASEIKNVKRNLPLSLIIGTLFTTILYLMLNIVFMLSAPFAELSGEINVGFISAKYIFGEEGSKILSALIATGLISTISAMVWGGPRVVMVMAEDYQYLFYLAKRSEGGAPYRAILLQWLIVIILIVTSTFEPLLTYLGLTLTIFTTLTVLGSVILRIKKPDLLRPFKTTFYPITPILFLSIQIWTIFFVIKEKPHQAFWTILTILLGFILYYIFRKREEFQDES